MPDDTPINHPDLWARHLVWPGPDSHKYHRGHCLVLGAEAYTGATRLAAEASSRIGSGLVTVFSDTCPDLYRITLPPDIMVRSGKIQQVRRPNVVLAGPGGCTASQIAELDRLNDPVSLVLDAEAILLGRHRVRQHPVILLTPHEAEFARVFPDLTGSRMARARQAAEATGCMVLLKGAETCIAAPDGRSVCSRHASPWLAKAGTGDVLAGMVAGLLAQGMKAFAAACAAVWIHGEAGQRVGPGLVPQNMFEHLGPILRTLQDRDSRPH